MSPPVLAHCLFTSRKKLKISVSSSTQRFFFDSQVTKVTCAKIWQKWKKVGRQKWLLYVMRILSPVYMIEPYWTWWIKYLLTDSSYICCVKFFIWSVWNVSTRVWCGKRRNCCLRAAHERASGSPLFSASWLAGWPPDGTAVRRGHSSPRSCSWSTNAQHLSSTLWRPTLFFPLNASSHLRRGRWEN